MHVANAWYSCVRTTNISTLHKNGGIQKYPYKSGENISNHLGFFFTCILIVTNKEIYARVKIPTIIETIRLNRLRWFGHVQRMEGNRIPKRVLYMNLGTTKLSGRPRIDGKMR